jgi:hypothetical protein
MGEKGYSPYVCGGTISLFLDWISICQAIKITTSNENSEQDAEGKG